MNFIPKAKDIFKYVFLILALLSSFWLLTIFELSTITSNGIKTPGVGIIALYKLANDFWAVFLVAILVLPVFLWVHSKKFGMLCVKIFLTIILLIQFSLVKYSLTTLLNLGADLLGYSLDDIYITVSSSEEMSFTYFLPFIIIPSIFWSIHFLLTKYGNTRSIVASFALLTFLFGV